MSTQERPRARVSASEAARAAALAARSESIQTPQEHPVDEEFDRRVDDAVDFRPPQALADF